ncbi:hypothetical protein [Absidia glauca]|uniref:Uncharacterized protein n=1 Tax=Absidia glauca TaxID=4829 RepID=A0A163K0F1_ABSGL|nr:hypothetical protein [Absidia glauca]
MYERRTPAWNKESRAWVASVLHLSTLQIDTTVDDVLDHGGDDMADYALLSSQQTLALLTNGRKRVYESDEFDDDGFDCDVFDDYYSDFEFGYDSDFGISDNDNPSQACSVDGNLHDS